MNIFFFLVIILTFLILLLFLAALKVKLVFDSINSDLNMSLLWLYPLFKVFVTPKDSKPLIILYLFNKEIFRKKLKKSNNSSANFRLVKSANPKDVNINANYGFKDPFITGVACGALNVASQFINIESLNNNPDFTPDQDYVYMDATAKVNLGSMIVNLLKQK